MGLDMYLTARRFGWGKENDEIVNRAVREAYELTEDYELYDVRIEVGYWRKANHIHMWFVNNVQREVDDCGTYRVTAHDLETLRDTCLEVLNNHTLAPSLLPTSAGFFFGSTTYEDHYFESLTDTVEIMNRAISLPTQWEVEYRSSW